MKNLILLFSVIIISLQSLLDCASHTAAENITADSVSTVTISFVGDLMCHTPQLEYSKAGRDSFDFNPSFREIKKYFLSSDLALGNLETTISGRGSIYSGYPLFNSPDLYLSALRAAGFKLLFTANNHALDRGKKGVLRTIEKINENKMIPVGTFISDKDRDSIRIMEINGIRIVFLAYTFGMNGNYISSKEKYLVNVIDTNIIKKDIWNARSKGTDAVVIYFHFGDEYSHTPSEYQKSIVRFAEKYGADIIIGSHPHSIQPGEYFQSSKNNIGKGLVVYSLGNFLSNQRWRYSDAGMILKIKLEKNCFSGKTRLSDVAVNTTWIFKGNTGVKNEFVILPVDTAPKDEYTFLTQSDREKMAQANRDTRIILENILAPQSEQLNQKNK